MSLDLLEKQVKAFLADKTPSVLAICGKWGTGKTRYWKDAVKAASGSESSFALPRYGYVSVFGINSLESLKREIFASIMKRESIVAAADDGDMLKTLGEGALELGTGALEKFFKNSASMVESICFSSVKQTIICIDDLERIGSSLKLKDILGLASLLKEEKDCKIVFILNDGEDGLDDFKKYHEKVVDLSLRFDPTVEECADIVLDGNDAESESLRQAVCKLDITNIRTIKKIKRVVKLAIPLLEDFDSAITEQAIEAITLFGWCHYRANDSEIPTIDHVTSSGAALIGLGASKTISDREKLWNTRIREYGYQGPDELDLSLLKGFTDGYFGEDELKKFASTKNALVVASKSSGSFSDAWSIFHNSFADNHEDVVSTLFQSFKDNVLHISPMNLNGMVTVFRKLGENAKADEALELYIESRDSTDGVFDLSGYAFGGDVTDSTIRKRFDEVHSSVLQEESLLEVLKRLSYRQSWNQSDEVFLAETSVDDFQKVFENEPGPELSAYIDTCLKFGQFSNSSDQQKKIVSNATDALRRLSTDSTLNKLRLEKFGITLEE